MITYRKNKNWDFVTIELFSGIYSKQLVVSKINNYKRDLNLKNVQIDIIDTIFIDKKVIVYFAIIPLDLTPNP